MDNVVKVLLADQHTLVREGIRELLETIDFIDVQGETDNLSELMEIIPKAKPDIILLDSNFSDGDGITGCSRIKELYPNVKVIVLTECTREYIMTEMINAGASCYLLKSVSIEDLVDYIMRVHEGECVIDEIRTKYALNFNTQKAIKSNGNLNKLSPREKEVLKMLSCGKQNKEISDILSISEKTVRNYISQIFKKLNVNNRTEAAIYWIRQKSLN